MENTNAKSLLEVAEIYLTYKSNVKPSLRPKVNASRDAYEILLKNWDSEKIELCEQFKVMLLNRANKAIGIFEVSSGSATGTVADPRLIFASALKANACGLIIAHNHPSGNLKPSQTDIELTKKLREGGRLLEIPLLDHLIVPAGSLDRSGRTKSLVLPFLLPVRLLPCHHKQTRVCHKINLCQEIAKIDSL